MGLEVFYPQDIRNALQAAREANLSTASAGDVSPEYLQGFNDALTVIATAFGLGHRERVRWPTFVLALEQR